MATVSAELQHDKVRSMNRQAFIDLAPDHGQARQQDRLNLRLVWYDTILELQFFQTMAPRAELREGGAIQPDMDQLQDLETSLDCVDVANNEAHVLRRRVLVMMLAGELDFRGAVPDGVGDPDVGVFTNKANALSRARSRRAGRTPRPRQTHGWRMSRRRAVAETHSLLQRLERALVRTTSHVLK